MKEVVKAGRTLPGAPYSPCVRAGGLLFISGQIPLDPNTGQIVPGGFREQVSRCLENLKHLLEEAGCSLDCVVKTTVFVTDLSLFGELNEVYKQYFAADPPARSAVQVSRLPMDAAVEIEAVAVVP